MVKARSTAPLLLSCLAFAFATVSQAQSITVSRPSVEIGPVADQCLVGTCVEATAARTGICAVEVLDNSGSMNTNDRFGAAQAGITQFVDSLRVERGDWIGLVTFSGPPLVFGATPLANPGTVPVTKQVDPVSQAFDGVKSIISGLGTSTISSLTPLAAGIETGTEVLANCPANTVPVMIVSTDGLPNWNDDVQCDVTPLSSTSCTNAAVDAATAAKDQGIHIVTIGIDLNAADASDAFGISLLKDVATSPVDANFFNTADGFGQEDIFAHVAGSVASPNDVQFVEPLPDACWAYVPGSTSGTISDDPTVDSIDGSDILTWSLGTVADGETAELCYSMAYAESCGTSPAKVTVQSGGSVSWEAAGGGATSLATESQKLQNIVECRVVIPVELVDFRGTSGGRDVTLVWHTASELNNAGFGIERSSRGGAFEQVDFVIGQGTSTIPREYRYVDTDLAPGVHRYRLRQTDLDGSFEFSATVEVKIEIPESHVMGPIYPNPLRDVAVFDLSVARTQTVRIELLDATGRVVRTLRDSPLGEGSAETIRLDATGIPAGIYVVRVSGDYFTASRLAAVVR
ncbi:MAG: VWA domain-containing protein [Rhodothermales bacterium]